MKTPPIKEIPINSTIYDDRAKTLLTKTGDKIWTPQNGLPDFEMKDKFVIDGLRPNRRFSKLKLPKK